MRGYSVRNLWIIFLISSSLIWDSMALRAWEKNKSIRKKELSRDVSWRRDLDLNVDGAKEEVGEYEEEYVADSLKQRKGDDNMKEKQSPPQTWPPVSLPKGVKPKSVVA